MERIERSHIISEKETESQNRLVNRFQNLVNKRLDLERVKRGVIPAYHQLASQYKGNLEEAINIADHTLFNTWLQVQEYGDEDIKTSVEKERLRLMNFLYPPLDDR